MSAPRFLDDAAYKALRAGDLNAYHRAIENRKVVDFTGADLRGVDLRNVDLNKVILRDAYLRDADLRGCDMRHVDLTGASIQSARISGTYFPHNLDAAEILLSIQFGARLRTQTIEGLPSP